MVVILAAFAALARTAFHPSIWPLAVLTAGVLLCHPRYECGANRTETFVVAAELTAVLGYVRWLHGGRTAWLVLGGLAAGAAPWFKQSGLAAAAACALHLAYVQLRARRCGADIHL